MYAKNIYIPVYLVTFLCPVLKRRKNSCFYNCVNITPRESSEEQILSEVEIHILIICPLTSMNACHNYQKIRGKVHLEHNFSYHRFRYVASCCMCSSSWTVSPARNVWLVDARPRDIAKFKMAVIPPSFVYSSGKKINCGLIWVANAYTDIFRIA